LVSSREGVDRMSKIGFPEMIMQDIFYGLKTLWRNPAFALTAVLTLALGIGATTTVFTMVHAVLLKPLDYHEPDFLVHVTGGSTSMRFEEMVAAARSYTELGAFTVGRENVTLSGADRPEALKGARVSANFLRILGVEPMLGRSFLPEEDRPGGPLVAMISAELWRHRFGADPAIAGRTATLAAVPHTIIGVLPVGFRFPFSDVDVWVTQPSEWSVIPVPARRLSPILSVFGRLKPNVDVAQASAELAVLNRQYAIAHPGMLDSKPNSVERVSPLKDRLVGNIRPMLWMLFGAVGFVLLIACSNVASLLLARATSRSREFAVRASLGAGRGRLIGQMLAESVLLAFGGGALGLLMAQWSLNGISKMTALDLPRAGEIRLDGMVLGFAIVLSMGTALLFGLVPSLGASRPDLAGALRASGESPGLAGARRAATWFSARGFLVAGQVALSMVLLIGATLLMESLARLRRVDPGFQAANLLTMQIALPSARYDTVQKKAAFYDELVRRVESVHGVRSAAVALTLPMTGFSGTAVQIVGQPSVKLNERPIAIVQNTTPGFFSTMGIPLRRGRDFTTHDTQSAPLVVIINESLARRFWPTYPNGPDPVGQHLVTGVSAGGQIIGIAADVRQAGLAVDTRPGLYRPCAQVAPQSAMLAVRTEGDPLWFVSAIRGQVLAIDRDQPITAVKTMDNVVEESEGQRRSIMVLLGLFAGAALLLAVIGIYGVIAYSVAQRTKEVGIRRALGAQQDDILRLVLGQALGLTLAGAVLGIGGAFALTRVMKSLLFQVSATDPLTFAGITVLLILVALAASYIPARRATRIDPTVALRFG
jgi:putative ABC transport system permease protein